MNVTEQGDFQVERPARVPGGPAMKWNGGENYARKSKSH